MNTWIKDVRQKYKVKALCIVKSSTVFLKKRDYIENDSVYICMILVF